MTRHAWWKPLATAGFVAGLLAATLMTATAASEGGLLGRGGQGPVQAPPAQSDGSPTEQSQTGKSAEAPRPWVWAGEVGQSELESGHLELRGTCGAWALLPADEAVKTTLTGMVGKTAFVIGRVSTDPNVFMRPTIRVEQVVTEKSQVPGGTKLFLGCGRQTPQRAPRTAPTPGFLGILEQMGLQGLQKVPQDQRFEHFLSVQATFLDADGKTVTARLTAGAATAVATDSLTIDPNGPESSMTVKVDASTKVLRSGDGGLAEIVPGDKVLVLQLNDTTAAIVASRQVTATVWPGMIGSLSGQLGLGGPGLAMRPMFGMPGMEGIHTPGSWQGGGRLEPRGRGMERRMGELRGGAREHGR